MTYPGNSSLASDVQQRISSTFEHTLGLAEKGSRQEALLGCDFVLRMDPLFEPARRLQERLEAGIAPVLVDDLRRMEAAQPAGDASRPPQPAAAPSPGPPPRPPASKTGLLDLPDAPWAEFEGLASELPELPDTHVPGLRAEFAELLAERRFQELQIRAGKEAATVTGDLELQRMVTLAQERLEAGPYVSKFLLSARDASRAGNRGETNRLLEKARALDPTHPGIAELERSAGGGVPGAVAGPAGAGAAAGAAAADGPGDRGRREPEMQTMPISGAAAAAARATGGAPAAVSTSPAGGAVPNRPPAGADDPAGPSGPAWSPAVAMPMPSPMPRPAGGFSGAAPTPAFAVPAPSPAGPPAAPAPPLSSLAPQPSPPPPAPALSADSDGERRIRQLLDDGQAALDGGDPQAAIDVWSRIFLIDIDHQEAARRIEQARRMKAERDRQVEETFHDGLARLEAKDPVGARQAFARVLELQPGHLQSREYLQQLDEGSLPAVAAGDRTATGKLRSPASPPAPGGPSADWAGTAGAPAAPLPAILPLPADLVRAAAAPGPAPDRDLQEEILVPPDLGEAAGRAPEARHEARSAVAARHGRARRLFLLVGSAVLLLVLAVGWYFYQKREQLFPNSRTEEPAPPPAPNPIPRAVKLHDTGKVAMALAQLNRVPPSDPHYKEAQAWIARWRAEEAQAGAGGAGLPNAAEGPASAGGAPGTAAGTPGSAAAPGGAGGADSEQRRALLEEARKAYQQNSYLLAAERYEAAGRLGKLDADDTSQFGAAKQKLVPLQRQLAMFRGHDWELALPELWRLHETDSGNKDVTRMMVDSYYNLAVRDLQHNDATKAAERFGEAQKLAPDDPEVKHQLLFAQTYRERGTDLLYRIYVKYLALR